MLKQKINLNNLVTILLRHIANYDINNIVHTTHTLKHPSVLNANKLIKIGTTCIKLIFLLT